MSLTKSFSRSNNHNDMSPFEMVGQFHKIIGHPARDTIDSNIAIDNPSLIAFRLKLIKEELDELIEARENLYLPDNDYIDQEIVDSIKHYYGEIMDACGDLLYVLNGMLHVIGYNYDILDNKTHCVVRTENTMKFHHSSKFQKEMSLLLITNLIYAYECMNENKNDIKIIISFSCYMINLIKTLSSFLCFDIYEVSKRVHYSNMTKLCYSIDEVNDTIEKYKKMYIETNNSNFQYPTCKIVEEDKIFMICNFDPSKGQEHAKILKSINFKQPDFENLINKNIAF